MLVVLRKNASLSLSEKKIVIASLAEQDEAISGEVFILTSTLYPRPDGAGDISLIMDESVESEVPYSSLRRIVDFKVLVQIRESTECLP